MIYGQEGLKEEVRQGRKSQSLLKTEGNGWDAGCAVRFLAGDESRWITGIMLPVDAGSSAAPCGDGMSQGMGTSSKVSAKL